MDKSQRKAVIVWCVFCLLLASGIRKTEAISTSQFYAFGEDQDEYLDPTKDDVNDNGLLSFVTEVPSFFNAQFPLAYPIIAPLYSDVDTRASGKVYYRETQAEDLLERANSEIRKHFTNRAEFSARSLFIATWDRVGSYNQRGNLVNTYQVIIASDGKDSYVIFLYPEDGITWIQGDGKLVGHPDARAQAGFMAGDGRLYTLRGSGTDQARNFDKMSNVGQHGVWMFHVGQTGHEGNVLPADLDTLPPGFGLGVNPSCATTQIPCPPTARCTDYESGFCCQCLDDYIGNGKNCLLRNMSHRLNGKVNGVLNDVPLVNNDLFAHIETSDGRTYTAISRIPPSIGYDMQALVTLGGVVSWLFGVPRAGMKNGFMLTGGVFERKAEVEFPQSGHRVFITEKFSGLDVFSYMKMHVEIRGSLPTIAFGSHIQIEDYEEEYTRVSEGVIRSHSARAYRLPDSIVEVPYVIDQTITFEECEALPLEETQTSMRLKITRNFVSYEEKEEIVRYGSANKIVPLTGDDPCKEGRNQCGAHSKCVVEGDSFRCICDQGYEYFYEENVNGERATCIDINECTSGRNNCHLFADCVNLPGSFACRCGPGYIGNGLTCEKIQTCADKVCDVNAVCIEGEHKTHAECRCNYGYEGDGIVCYPVNPDAPSCATSPGICDPNADCVAVETTPQQYVCFCRPGYRGNGFTCIPEKETCDIANNCDPNAQCMFDPALQGHFCVCNLGFYGDGYNCQPEEPSSCNEVNDCHPHAQCVYDRLEARYVCRCNFGFTGDGYQCTKDEVGCDVEYTCSIHADCMFDPFVKRFTCQCADGFDGDGITCKPIDECNTVDDCDPNAQCIYDNTFRPQRYHCQCNPGFTGDGKQCFPDQDAPCNVVNNCDRNARCVYDTISLQYVCQCDRGFQGDGIVCQAISLSCDVINNCDIYADCVYSASSQSYQCQCRDGYEGNGLTCYPIKSCRDDRYLCDPNADCIRDLNSPVGFRCHCRDGFVGDGYQCSAVPSHESGYLVFSQGMSILRMPFEPTRNDNGKLILMRPSQTGIGLDIDCVDGQMYWTDIFHKAIMRSNYDGSDVTPVIETDLHSPEGIAVDWVSRNIYWTDSVKDTIEVANLDGSARKVLIKDNLVNPRGIALHPHLGLMFWTDWNRNNPKIEVAKMDGSDRLIFVKENLGLPNMLAIDLVHDDLCWTDAGLHRIECIGVNGVNRRIIHTPAAYPFDLTVAEGNIYWTDWEINFIQKIDRNGGIADALEIPLGGNGKLYGLTHVPKQCPRVTNACAVRNGGCRHLCLPNGYNTRTCVCPDAPNGEEDEICNELV